MKGGTCPMCRKNVHYRRMPIKKWKMEADNEKKEAIFQESFDLLLDVIMEPLTFMITDQVTTIPDTHDFDQTTQGDILKLHRRNVSTYDLEDMQKTFRAIKDDCDAEEIDYILNETDDYFSDRKVHLRNRIYSEQVHWYNFQKRNPKNINNKPIRWA